METRLIEMTDAPALAVMHAHSFESGVWDLRRIAGSMALPTTLGWIATRHAEVRGFILCQAAADEMEILTFCVMPDARRQGAGQRLIDRVLDAARKRKAKRVHLEVADDNQAARALYEKAGFKQAGRRANYYARDDRPVDAVTFAFEL